MGKHTTQKQFALLVDFMEKHPDLGRGWVKTDNKPEYIDKLWDDLTCELNAVGLPWRDSSGWKKVWSDYKVVIKRKLIQHEKEKTATGGGEFKQLYLSPLEEIVVRITAMETAVKGIENTRSFGGSTTKKINMEHQDRETTAREESESPSSSKRYFVDETETSNPATNKRSTPPTEHEESQSRSSAKRLFFGGLENRNPITNKQSTPLISSTSAHKTHCLLEKQIEINQTFHNDEMNKFNELISINREIAASLKRNYRAMEKLCDIQKIMADQFKQNFEEEAAHRSNKEYILNKKTEHEAAHQNNKRKLIVQKIEIKNKMLLLEEQRTRQMFRNSQD